MLPVLESHGVSFKEFYEAGAAVHVPLNTHEWTIHEAKACLEGQPIEKIGVLRNPELGIKRLNIADDISADSQGLHVHSVVARQNQIDRIGNNAHSPFVVPPRAFKSSHGQMWVVHVPRISKTRTTPILEQVNCLTLPFKLFGEPVIVRVKEGNPLTTGGWKSVIESHALATILLPESVDPIPSLFGILPKQRLSLVGRTIIHHKDFAIRVRLRKHTVNRALQE